MSEGRKIGWLLTSSTKHDQHAEGTATQCGHDGKRRKASRDDARELSVEKAESGEVNKYGRESIGPSGRRPTTANKRSFAERKDLTEKAGKLSTCACKNPPRSQRKRGLASEVK